MTSIFLAITEPVKMRSTTLCRESSGRFVSKRKENYWFRRTLWHNIGVGITLSRMPFGPRQLERKTGSSWALKNQDIVRQRCIRLSRAAGSLVWSHQLIFAMSLNIFPGYPITKLLIGSKSSRRIPYKEDVCVPLTHEQTTFAEKI